MGGSGSPAVDERMVNNVGRSIDRGAPPSSEPAATSEHETHSLTRHEIEGLINEGYSEGVEGYPPILGVSQPTVSRAVKALTEAIALILKGLMLTAKKVPEGCDYVVDGALFPCWDWRRRRDLWSR